MYNLEVEFAHEYVAEGFLVHNCDGCIAYAGYWMPIWQCPPIGTQQCGSRCHCKIIYRGPAGTVL